VGFDRLDRHSKLGRKVPYGNLEKCGRGVEER